jgi:Carboxypeptidase regulatory-like domain
MTPMWCAMNLNPILEVPVYNPDCKTRIAFAIKLLCLLMTLPMFTSLKAQSFYGSIVGSVADASGAVVPNAKVTVTDVGTGKALTVNTDTSGKFSFVDLVPSVYSVEVTKAGFKRFVERMTVEVGATTRLDPKLEVGAATETLVVTTQTALLQTDSSTLGQEVEGAEVQQMPLNGRNVMNLIALAPGVVPTGGAMGGTALNQGSRTGGGAGWGNYELGGAIQGQSAQFLDGVANNLLGGNIVALVPTQDAIQEFNVASSNAGADFGRFSGGVVNMTTKSGSNAFHGSAWEYLRNRDFNANDYFSNLSGKPRVKYNQNQYGAMATGPIKRDKAFFMFTWEGFKALTGGVATTEVPTDALQSDTPVFTHQITDPLGNCNIVNDPSAETWTITNLYQGACGDPTNRVLKTYYPAPNITGNSLYNWYYAGPLGNKQNQYNGRIDYTISPKQRLFGRYTYWHLLDAPAHSEFGQQGYGSTKWATDDGHVLDLTHQAVIGDTYTINPTTVLDVRLNYVRVTSPNYPATISQDEGAFDKYNPAKPYAALAGQMSVKGLPGFGLNGGYGFYNLANFPGFSVNWYNTYGLNANLVKILGAHSLKFGMEARLMDGSGSGFDNTESGQYQYGNSDFGTGDEWANFLMGYPNQVKFTTINSTAPYTYYYGYYVTDTWQATRNLTLNLGLRYELPGAISERRNRAYVMLPNINDPVQTAIRGTLQLVNSSLYNHRSTVLPEHNLFAPRVGFAYRAGGNSVVRGGYGISYLPSDIAGGSNSGLLSYNQTINGAQTQLNINTNGTPTQLQSLLAGLKLNQPIGRSKPDIIGAQGLASTTTFKNQNLVGPVPNQPYPYTQQWNFSISHEFSGNLMAEISTTGLKGTNIPGAAPNHHNGRNLNQLPDSFDSLGSGLKTIQACANAGGLIEPIGDCDRPFPYYNNVEDAAGFYARENYRSLQARVEKRMGAAGVFKANYTWSRNQGNTDTQAGYIESKSTQQGGNGSGDIQDFNNPSADYSLISFDVTNRAVVAYVVNLPFGKGQRFGDGISGPLNEAVSGWAINGVTTFQSGFPVFLSDSTQGQLPNYGAGTIRPMVVPGCDKKIGGSGLDRVKAGAWFSTSCFANVGATKLANGNPNPFAGTQYDAGYGFGNEPRTDPTLRSDGVKNFDVAIQKSTAFYESANLEFRAEFFNVFNRVQFAPPGNQVGSQNFGQVAYQVNRPRQIQLSLRVNF